MPVGSKSLLFGVHQLVLHPWLVTLSWRRLYGSWPSFREIVAIVLHDIGYWNLTEMDGPRGTFHPVLGARVVNWLFGAVEHDLILYHSRSLALRDNVDVSRLCAPDKLSILLYPRPVYLFLGWLSGELKEYKKTMSLMHLSDEEWLFITCRRNFEWVESHIEPRYRVNLQRFESRLEGPVKGLLSYVLRSS